MKNKRFLFRSGKLMGVMPPYDKGKKLIVFHIFHFVEYTASREDNIQYACYSLLFAAKYG